MRPSPFPLPEGKILTGRGTELEIQPAMCFVYIGPFPSLPGIKLEALIVSPCRFFRTGVSLCTALAIFIILNSVSASSSIYQPQQRGWGNSAILKSQFCKDLLLTSPFMLTFNIVPSDPSRDRKGQFFTKLHEDTRESVPLLHHRLYKM